ncbi:beta-ketoacyl synthase N-terminal-like domain-containing protein [Massilia sp. TSP1-1-2]|uniref:beta-ketoacyl synthase N-terminal-like domain-containing protein n=1 Tax=Massilia sp. TSP1-1-2 TaxID=2804649 RepID=UPI003CFA49B0
MNDGMRDVYISGAAAVSVLGFDWRQLGQAIMDCAPACAAAFAPSRQLGETHGPVIGAEVPAIPAQIDVDARSRKLMSHPARLAAVALRLALLDAAWPQHGCEETALYLGVGASGCAMDELNRMLAESIAERKFSQARFGSAGLAACNPLFAFQLMNNFTLCHGAILNGTGGANGAFYSRGTGTVAALAEARWHIAAGECARALAGGADSAMHPVTWAQLVRDGYPAKGFIPGEGAGVLALSASADGALARLEKTAFHSVRAYAKAPLKLTGEELADAGSDDLIVLAPWGNGARDRLYGALHGTRATVVDASIFLGDALAAAPSLAWCAALDLLRQGHWRRAFVLNAGIDGGIGLAVMGRMA